MRCSSNVVELGYRCFRVELLFSNDVFRQALFCLGNDTFFFVVALRFSEACAKAKKYSSLRR
jgi:hypothetical protein